jgi:hypothetical protein
VKPLVVVIDSADLQRAADALHAHAQKTGSGYCPAWWSGRWQDWYREVAGVVVAALAEPSAVDPSERVPS